MFNSYIFTDKEFFSWVTLPVIIILSRMLDVSLGTFRIILITRGKRKYAPIFGFFEVLLWITVVSQIFQNVSNIACYLAWATGFALGNYIGMFIEAKIAMGTVIIRIITNQDCSGLIETLQKSNFGVTIIEGKGSKGAVKILFTVIDRKKINYVEKIISNFNPNAFYTIEDVREAHQLNWIEQKRFNYFRRIFPYGKWK